MQHSLGYLYLKFALVSIVSCLTGIVLFCGLFWLLITFHPPLSADGHVVMATGEVFLSIIVSSITFLILYYKLWVKYELIRKWLASKFKK